MGGRREAWGAIAARLGRRSNRSDFVQRFWWGEQAEAKGNGKPGPRPDAGEERPPLGLQKMLQLQSEHLQGYHRSPFTPNAPGAPDPNPEADAVAPLGRETWKQAVRRFTRARERVQALAAERQAIDPAGRFVLRRGVPR
ncbi:hypothetical protein [Embleya sp. NPDC020630]|uniref:hypothetical protein n=1 Tax=Embleya sp. NPDC020630 TaxID=3363979 RepID=UPI00378F3612